MEICAPSEQSKQSRSIYRVSRLKGPVFEKCCFMNTMNANWMPISYIYKRRMAAIMYNVKSKTLPESILNLFETNENPTSRELRNNSCFKSIQPRTEFGRNSIRFRGPAIWKVIPTETKNCPSYNNFKNKLSTIRQLINNIQFEKGQSTTTFRRQDYLYF